MPELTDCKVQIENYYGPLDLLLHLVKEAEVDITQIALSRVAEQYVAFLDAMQEMNINLAGEFLVVASQLLLIKSRTILPAPVEEEEEEETEEEASLELLRKLLQYKQFKDRARALGDLMDERAQKTGRPRLKLEKGESEKEEPLENIDTWHLVKLWAKLSHSTQLEGGISILYHDVPVEVFMERIVTALREGRKTTFSELMEGKPERGKVIGTFLALLQLSKGQQIQIHQEQRTGEISIEGGARLEQPVQ
jgi:segregation and condensation protein A